MKMWSNEFPNNNFIFLGGYLHHVPECSSFAIYLDNPPPYPGSPLENPLVVSEAPPLTKTDYTILE